jgi:molybdopterin/thiamine biosynthesis adenylyltransferase
MPGKWRKEPFARRTYENLTEYKITSCIEPEEVQELKDLLQTPLNGFVGQAYNFDDHDITEDWMCSFKDGTSTRPSEQDIIRTQTESLLDIMVQQVQERVCTDLGVLDVPPVGLGKDLKEIPAWGIDCYTRKMVELAIEDRVAAEKRTAKSVTYFIQRQLLPSINRIEASKAHDMSYALLAIIEVFYDERYATASMDN